MLSPYAHITGIECEREGKKKLNAVAGGMGGKEEGNSVMMMNRCEWGGGLKERKKGVR